MNAASIYKSAEGEKVVMDLYNKVLERWPVPFEAMEINTRHGKTFVIASGEQSAPPLLLLHGSCSNAVTWVGEVAEYSRHFRIFAVDILGEPGRSAPNRPAWKSPAYAEWMEDILDSLQIQKVLLLGISQGGWVALKFAMFRPDRVAKLVLLAPGGIAPARTSFVLRALILSLFGRWGAEANNRIVFGKEPMDEAAINFMNAIMTHFKPRIGVLPIYSDEELTRLTKPTLLIVGLQDALFPSRKTAARMKNLLPNLTEIILPKAGHVLYNLAGEISPFLLTQNSSR